MINLNYRRNGGLNSTVATAIERKLVTQPADAGPFGPQFAGLGTVTHAAVRA